MTPSGIETASFLLVAQYLKNCATAYTISKKYFTNFPNVFMAYITLIRPTQKGLSVHCGFSDSVLK
jgi:hypothetical protein